MPDETQANTPTEPSLEDLLAHYIAGEEAGSAPDRHELLARHPQFAAELREFFVNRDQMRRLAQPLLAAPEVSRAAHRLGKIRYFGDYELLEEVAAGGMGIIYKARQRSLNRIVAVKMILLGSLAREDDVKRFRAEAEAAASLQHPAIVAIHEVGLHEGQHYFSMDFVDGHSLAELPREQPLSAHQAAEYIRDAAEAVHYAHQQGTLHRDLKPSNILIDRQSRVRITDFGLAKRIEGNSDLTLTGQILGTPSYMPPEQATSKRSLVGVASDIYSLGAVLYELLTGRPPFRGESPAETLRQVETLDPVSPRLLSPATPRDLETICLKCLEKEPHKRYGTAQLLADDLGRYLRGEPISARPISRAARVWRWCRRNPTGASLAVVSCVATVILIGGLAIANALITAQRERVKRALDDRSQALIDLSRQQNETHESLNRERAALAEKTRLLEERDDANDKMRKALDQQQKLSYYHLIDLAGRERDAGNLELARGFLSDCREELRGWEWYYLNHRCRTPGFGFRELSTAHRTVQAAHRTAAFSPNGQLVVSVVYDDDGQLTRAPVRIWSAATGEELHRIELSSLRPSWPPFDAAFDPTGKQLAVATNHSCVDLVDVESGKVFHTFPTAGSAYRVMFSNDGKKLLSAHAFGGATVWDVEARSEIRTIKTKGRCCSAVFNADNTEVVTGDGSGRIEIWELATGKLLATLQDQPARPPFAVAPKKLEPTDRYCNAVIFSPDYSQIAAAFASGRAIIWDSQTHEVILVLKGHTHWIYNISFSHDGKRIVTAGRDGTIKLWDAKTFREILTLKGHEGRVFCALFSPNDQILVSAGEDGIRLWDAPK